MGGAVESNFSKEEGTVFVWIPFCKEGLDTMLSQTVLFLLISGERDTKKGRNMLTFYLDAP